jgi:hypothetical protein
VIITPNTGRDYFDTYSQQTSRIPGESTIGFHDYQRCDYHDWQLPLSKPVSKQALQSIKLQPIYSTVAPGIAGSGPVRSAIWGF